MSEPRTPPAQGSPTETLRPQRAQRKFHPDLPIPDLSDTVPDSSPVPRASQLCQKPLDDSDQKITKINQAKNVLEELLNNPGSLGSKAMIMDGIEILDLIITQLQSPQELYDQDLTPMDRVIYKMKLDMVKVNTKVDQILEKSRPKTPAQPLDT